MMSLMEFSTASSVHHGQYDGGISIAELKEKGNFGLGAFHALDGELISFDNRFFHCQNRKCTPATDDQLLAWTAVCNFNPCKDGTTLLPRALNYVEEAPWD